MSSRQNDRSGVAPTNRSPVRLTAIAHVVVYAKMRTEILLLNIGQIPRH